MMELITPNEFISIALATGLLLVILVGCPEGPTERAGRHSDNSAVSVVDQIQKTSNGVKSEPETEEQRTHIYF